MNAEEILALIQAGIAVLPQLWDLYARAKAGTPVTADEVLSALNQYGIDRAQAAKDLAALQGEPFPPPTK